MYNNELQTKSLYVSMQIYSNNFLETDCGLRTQPVKTNTFFAVLILLIFYYIATMCSRFPQRSAYPCLQLHSLSLLLPRIIGSCVEALKLIYLGSHDIRPQNADEFICFCGVLAAAPVCG